MTGGHILVESIDSGDTGHLTVLLVHVVGTGARVVADPDTEVLDLLGTLLVDLSQSVVNPLAMDWQSVFVPQGYAPG